MYTRTHVHIHNMYMHYTQMGRETETHRQAHRTQIEENTQIYRMHNMITLYIYVATL